jgi:hypothetical protein
MKRNLILFLLGLVTLCCKDRNEQILKELKYYSIAGAEMPSFNGKKWNYKAVVSSDSIEIQNSELINPLIKFKYIVKKDGIYIVGNREFLVYPFEDYGEINRDEKITSFFPNKVRLVIQPPINQTVFYGCINSFTF